MQISGVISLRNIFSENFRDIVFEWEDSIVSQIDGKLIVEDNIHNSFAFKLKKRLLDYAHKYNQDISKPMYLAFCMTPVEIVYYRKYNILPVFIDVWSKDIDSIKKTISDKIAIVTSLDIFNMLKSECKNIIYMPLSISDKWIQKYDYSKKRFMMVQMGRKNEILHEFALRYSKINPEVEYVYAEYNSDNKALTYYSTKRGMIPTPKTRKEYMNTLREASICLVSSPGIDGSRPIACGVDYPTPRFYEAAISYCWMLGRYDNSHCEFGIQHIDKIVRNINTFEEFTSGINNVTNRKLNISDYEDFIKMHLTSTWIEELIHKINL